MAKEDNTYKQVWLHDENKNFIITPYTTVDNIKIKNKDDFIDFTASYNLLEQKINNNENLIDTFQTKINNYSEILYGDSEPEDNQGKNTDIYIQYKNNQISKIWQKLENHWVYFQTKGGPNIKISNINSNNKPKMTINIKVSNAD